MDVYEQPFGNSLGFSAPIAVFGYRRPEKLKRCLEHLARCPEARSSDLTIFVDGPKSETEVPTVKRTRQVAEAAQGFRRITTVSRSQNLGLSNSIISGVNFLLESEETLIIVEDDLEVAPDFLRFMNTALEIYKDSANVISVHGYCYPTAQQLPETFFLRGADCWGWATWRRGWEVFNPDGDYLLREIKKSPDRELFNFNGSANYLEMLEQQTRGEVDSWAIRWYASAFLAEKITLYPGESLVRNTGLDGSGTHGPGGRSHDVRFPSVAPQVERIKPVESAEARAAFESFFRNRLGGRKVTCSALARAGLRRIQRIMMKGRWRA